MKYGDVCGAIVQFDSYIHIGTSYLASPKPCYSNSVSKLLLWPVSHLDFFGNKVYHVYHCKLPCASQTQIKSRHSDGRAATSCRRQRRRQLILGTETYRDHGDGVNRTSADYSPRKFRSQTSDNMDRWKAEQGRGREKRKIRREKSRRERVRRKKMEMREKVGKSRFTVFFQWFVAPGGRKVGSLKRRVRSHLARGEMKSCTPLWREAHLEVKMYKTHHSRTSFGSWDVEKVHAVVARSTFPSQNVKNTTCSRHFWRFGCWKSARRCGAKHISKSTCSKH